MARFYGIVQGGRGEATRLGHAATGLETTAASYDGAVKVRLYVEDGTDYAEVRLTPWHGSGTDRLLYDGPVSGLSDPRHARPPKVATAI